MSLELDIRFWWDAPDVQKQMREMLAAFEASQNATVRWTRAVLKRGETTQDGLSLNSPVTTVQVMDWIVDDLSHYKVTVHGSLPCWRYQRNTAELATVPIAFSFWGKEFGKSEGLDPQIAGHAQLTILQSSPYFGVVIPQASAQQAQARHDHIAENLEVLIHLLEQITLRTKPSRWMAHSNNSASFLPIHAHAAWFARPELLLKSVQETLHTAREGNPADRLPAVALLDQLENTGYQHAFRTAAEAADLLQRLKTAAAQGQPPTLAHVQSIIDSKRFDAIAIDQGHIFLDQPFFLNSFLDGLLLACIPLPVAH